MSRQNEWDTAYRIAAEIPACSGPAKHQAISALLVKRLDLLRTVPS